MSIRRVAVIFDNQVRPDTTGVYCRRALGQLVEVEHFLPVELARVPAGEFDLYLFIDDGLEYALRPDLHPSAWWAIDTHLNPDWCQARAGNFDFGFAAQRDGAELLRQAGHATASWLPLACDPEFHRKHDGPKRFDVSFVGHLFPGSRSELVELIRGHFRNSFIGQRFFEEMAQIYSASRLVFNRSIRNDINMRVFEALACSSLLMTNDLGDNGQDELFQDGVHLATYRDGEELLDKIRFYLDREELRERLAAAGRSEALSRHTYRHRMQTILESVAARLSTKTFVPQSADPTRVPGQSQHHAVTFPESRLLDLVPLAVRDALALGPDVGHLAKGLEARQDARVTTSDGFPQIAFAGRSVWNSEGAEARSCPEFAPASFDAIVFDGFLELIGDPLDMLRQARSWLKPDGHLIAALPNARHHSMVSALLGGHWPTGLLGPAVRDPMRTFTRREIEKLLSRGGFDLVELRAIHGPGFAEWQDQGRPGEVRCSRFRIEVLQPEEAEEFYVDRYLVRAVAAGQDEPGLTSIIIITHNQLAYTRLCLESIRARTDEPYELIVIDNASGDGTLEYLRAQADVRLITNDANRGFPAAVNQGIALARGEQVLLLNNDVVVTTGWLRRLLRALHGDPKIGLTGPCSNFVSGPQQVETHYESLADLDGFAWDWSNACDGRRVDVDRLVGFCLLVRRSVVEAVGLLDEQFGLGCFEDDDYCRRAIQAGYRAVIAGDAFVHHFGGRTFVGSGVDFGALMRENERRFRAKWSNGNDMAATPATPDRAVVGSATLGPFELTVAPGDGLLVRPGRVRLSLCMIVRDSARTLPACLESIRPWVDEMVIVDTGSVDETPRIVESFGGRLFHFPWCDDFSAARNESLRHARGEWIFWMDSDDTIPPECGHQLRELIDRAVDPGLLGYIMQVHCPSQSGDGDPMCDATIVDHVKLFRNRPDLRFDGRLHEQVLGAIRRAGGAVAWTDVYVVHSGSDHSPETEEKKLDFHLRLLELELAERPEHPFTLFNFGMTHVHASHFAEGADYLRRSIARSGSAESHLRKAYALLAYAELRIGHREEALETCRRGRELFPLDAELRFREGVLLHDLGRLAEARQAYLGVLETREERHLTSIDRGITGFKARQNLAVLAADVGDLAEAERQWREVVREAPRYRPGWRGLGDSLIRLGRTDEGQALADRLLSDQAIRIEGALLKHRIALTRGRIEEARLEIDRAATERPDDLEGLRARCQFLFEHGSPDEAEAALRGLIARQPQDPSAHYNLGTLLLRSGRFDEAEQAYRQSLRYRSNHAGTYLQLGYALKETGRTAEAAEAWEQVLRLSPGHPAASAELDRMNPAHKRQGLV
jgi:O-antigen biosynthesis protein